ncbi:MAG: glutathione S-transferase N-terminal domain-containing protein [Gammaproteobacteria bacterium]|nr:glutathione S-transferase N-terminal domain-containing protein [Gammaproteobacteria bacterium]
MGFIFKPVRWILGQIIIFIDWATRPKPIQRSAEAQAEVDKQTENMALYHFQMCPFCVKTRRQIHRLGLNIENRDARYDEKWNQELIDEGGKYQVPCLKITREDGSVEWMYESTDINQYLEEKFSADS